MFHFSGVELPFLSRTDSSALPYFTKIGNIPARWGESVAWNLKFLFWEASTRERSFSCVLKFEHALVVRSCDVFETAYSGSLVSKGIPSR